MIPANAYLGRGYDAVRLDAAKCFDLWGQIDSVYSLHRRVLVHPDTLAE